jgi:hypothetical protein
MTSTFGAVEAHKRRWTVHRLTAACLRVAVVAAPLPVSAGVGVFVGWSVSGQGALDVVARVVAAGLASVATFAVLEWLARRLMPLAALLRLSLIFPDRAPSRFAIALRSTSVRRIREWARTNQDRLGEQALAEKVLTLASALNFHDRRTRGHSERTRAFAELVIDELGLSEAEANEVRWGAFLHDIGKLLVPSAILNKAGEPSAAEWETLRQHPAEGGRLVRALRPFIGSGVDAVSCHHESFDGTGYPNGMRGEEIPLAARIVAVVDSFEVMTAVRSYKRPMSATAARKELVREAGKQFDPSVVRAFVNVSLGRLHWALGLVAWAAELPFIGIVPRAAAQVGTAIGTGSGAVSTATLASVATASLGATLVVNPLAAPVPAPASAAPVPAASAGSALAGSAVGSTATGARTNGQMAGGGATPAFVPGSGIAASLAGTASNAVGTSRSTSASSGTAASGRAAVTGAGGGTASVSPTAGSSSSDSGTAATPGAATTSGDAGAAPQSSSDAQSGSGSSDGSGTKSSPGTTGKSSSSGSGIPIVSTVVGAVGGVVSTTLGDVGKLLTTDHGGSTSHSGLGGLLGGL